MKFGKLIGAAALALCAIMLMGADGCEGPADQVSASGAQQANPSKVQKNSEGRTVEQQNIYDRIKVTTDPTKVMWIHLVALDGKIIRRMPVRNKVTSSGKRLEPTSAASSGPNAESYPRHNGRETSELIQPDGTYGSSDAYIFWFDPTGRYHQYGTAGGIGYLVTDYPIDLADPIEQVTGLYNADKAAAEWQAREEAKLSQQEGK